MSVIKPPVTTMVYGLRISCLSNTFTFFMTIQLNLFKLLSLSSNDIYLSGQILGNKYICDIKIKNTRCRCSIKKLFFRILQYSYENTCVAISFFNKVAGTQSYNIIKQRLQDRCFPVNIGTFLKRPIFKKTLSFLFNYTMKSHIRFIILDH